MKKLNNTTMMSIDEETSNVRGKSVRADSTTIGMIKDKLRGPGGSTLPERGGSVRREPVGGLEAKILESK